MMLSIFSCTYWPILYLLWKNFYSNPLPIFNWVIYCSIVDWKSSLSYPVAVPASEGDMGLIPRSGRFPGKGNGNVLQYSCLGNAMDRGAWRTTVHEVAMSRT